MDKEKTITAIKNGQCILGIEFGSTRIKAVLIGEENVPVASGSHDWENRLVNQIDDVGGDRFQRNDARLSSV